MCGVGAPHLPCQSVGESQRKAPSFVSFASKFNRLMSFLKLYLIHLSFGVCCKVYTIYAHFTFFVCASSCGVEGLRVEGNPNERLNLYQS